MRYGNDDCNGYHDNAHDNKDASWWIWVLEAYSPLHCLFLSPAAKEEAKKFMTSPVTSSKQAATSQQSTAAPDDVTRHAQMADVAKDLLRMRKVKQKLDSVLVGVDYFLFERGLTLISLSTYRVFNCVREKWLSGRHWLRGASWKDLSRLALVFWTWVE